MTRTFRIGLTALTACAIAAPAASADAGQDLRNPDRRTPARVHQDLRNPDRRTPAPAHQDLRNPDRRTPAPVPADSPATGTFDDSRLLSPAADVQTPSGFAWGDAGIGAGIGAALVLSVSGAAVSVRRHRRRQTGTAIA
jgi:hypothetical protein